MALLLLLAFGAATAASVLLLQDGEGLWPKNLEHSSTGIRDTYTGLLVCYLRQAWEME